MKCSWCEQENPTQAKFCFQCAAPFARFRHSGAAAASYADLERALSEALEQQTATAEILRVISSSPTDIQRALDAVAKSAVGLCESFDAYIFRRDGVRLLLVAHHGPIPARTIGEFSLPLGRGTAAGRAVLDGQTVHIADIQAEADEFPEGSEQARDLGHRTVLHVPLMREGVAIGTIGVRRTEGRPFSEGQIALLRTFADQAVIAIENVRLFKELEARNRDLSATSEILQVISRSPTDEKPVFDRIVRSTIRLCDAKSCVAYRYDGEQLHVVAHDGLTPGTLALLNARYPQPPSRETATGVSTLERRVVHISDASAADIPPGSREFARQQGWSSLLAVPLLRDGQPVGSISVARGEREPFTDQQIALVKTFADQAVIAIENVRLFRELEAANLELAAGSQHKSEFLANMSHELRTPLNAVIGFSEVLSEGMFGQLNEKQEEYARDIYSSGQHLLSLINDILDLSKIEAGRMELELTDFHLPTALDNALTLVRERAGRRGIALGVTVDERLGEIRADERKIRQVVLNLLSNAIKFTPEGGRIEVRAAPVDGSVEISVTDTGVGIAPEDQEAIFEEFKQVGTAARKVEGTGLGLALSRKFIELHGGRISVKSEPGVGSTFTFSIPVHTGA